MVVVTMVMMVMMVVMIVMVMMVVMVVMIVMVMMMVMMMVAPCSKVCDGEGGTHPFRLRWWNSRARRSNIARSVWIAASTSTANCERARHEGTCVGGTPVGFRKYHTRQKVETCAGVCALLRPGPPPTG